MRRLAISAASVFDRMADSEAQEAFTPVAIDRPSGVDSARSRCRRRTAGRPVGTRSRCASSVASARLRDRVQMPVALRHERGWRGSGKPGALGTGRGATGRHPELPQVPGSVRGLIVLHTLTDALRAMLVGGPAMGASATATGPARSLAIVAWPPRDRGARLLTAVDSPLRTRAAGCLCGESSLGTRGWFGRRRRSAGRFNSKTPNRQLHSRPHAAPLVN
jgi:hypothetical protein